MSSPRLPQREFDMPPARPVLAAGASPFLLLEREVELEYRPRMLTALQSKVDAEATAGADRGAALSALRPADAVTR
jgi:hypothetical protein